MLSKVLSFGDACRAEIVLFPPVAAPDLGGHGDGRAETSHDDAPDPGEAAMLREQLHQTELRAARERAEALQTGIRQGEQQARAELQPVLERLHASIAEIVGMRPDLRRRAERDTVQLALLIARRVLHRQLSVDDSALTAIARVAFERLTRSESWRVTVHPRFAAAVTAALPPSSASRVQIEPDPSCAPGTLIIHSSEGTIDASIDAQLEEISLGLTDHLANL